MQVTPYCFVSPARETCCIALLPRSIYFDPLCAIYFHLVVWYGEGEERGVGRGRVRSGWRGRLGSNFVIVSGQKIHFLSSYHLVVLYKICFISPLVSQTCQVREGKDLRLPRHSGARADFRHCCWIPSPSHDFYWRAGHSAESALLKIAALFGLEEKVYSASIKISNWIIRVE